MDYDIFLNIKSKNNEYHRPSFDKVMAKNRAWGTSLGPRRVS